MCGPQPEPDAGPCLLDTKTVLETAHLPHGSNFTDVDDVAYIRVHLALCLHTPTGPLGLWHLAHTASQACIATQEAKVRLFALGHPVLLVRPASPLVQKRAPPS